MSAQALDVFDCPLDGINLIEASAGTGKTWNICGLYLRLLLEQGLEVDKILVVTFTNAATAELRERIRQRLVQMRLHLRGELSQAADPFVTGLHAALARRAGTAFDDDQALSLIEAALAAFGDASIFTIHGFCQRALADSAFAARNPLRSELLADDSELRQQVVNDFWRRHVAADTTPRPLQSYLLAQNDSPASLRRLLDRALARPQAVSVWPRGVGSDVDLATEPGDGRGIDPVIEPGNEPSDALWARYVDGFQSAFDEARALWLGQRTGIVECLKKGCPSLRANVYKADRVDEASRVCDELFRFGSAGDLFSGKFALLEMYSAKKIGASRKKDAQPPEHPFFDLIDRLLERRHELESELRLARLRLLRQMIDESVVALREEKRRRHLIAYDDMLQNLHRALHSGESQLLVDTLRTRFPAALIDEFQDTDPVQYGIFERIYGDGARPVFLVGDPKQSIYGFRSADLHTYLNARRRADREFTLDRNQRSSAELVGALNRLFCTNSGLFMLEGLDYHEVGAGQRQRAPLHGAACQQAALQVWMLPDGDDVDQVLQVGAARQMAANATAAEIGRLLAAAGRGEAMIGERALSAGDIAVLVRTHAEGAQMRTALSAAGITCVERSPRSVFDTNDALELERLLAAVLEPSRESLARAALATECFGMDASQISALQHDEALASAYAQRFFALRQAWVDRGVGFMLRRWLNDDGVASRLLAATDGERRLTNLLHLIECLHQAGVGHESPDALLRWLRARRRERATDEETQLRLESDEDLVQIVTIHASKGLEYPVVFCPFLWRDGGGGAARRDEGAEYRDQQGRLLIDWRDESDDGYDDAWIKQSRRREGASEFLRLVYVALTRAIYRCVLVVGAHRSGRARTVDRSTLLNWIVAGNGIEPANWSKPGPDASTIALAWHKLAESSDASIAVEPLPIVPELRPIALTSQSPGIRALSPPLEIPFAWRIGSFSSLVHGAGDELAAADRDHRVGTLSAGADIEDGPEIPATDILEFPRGPQAGESLHALMETIEFDNPDSWPAAIQRVLGGLSKIEHGEAMLAGMLGDLMSTPLAVGTANPLVLGSLPRSRRLVEMEFHLPCALLRDRELNALLAQAGYQGPRLGFAPLSGFLKGFIDLVFEHEGRFYVLDWKSNRLGVRASDYGPAQMAAEIGRHGYQLQYLLYCVALHRYLQRRLPDYDPQRHFGGAVYLFIRGVRPDWQLDDGSQAGVYFDRPAPALLAAIDAMLRGDEVPDA